MNKKSFTLIEMIFVIVILSFIGIGVINIISHLYKRNYIVKSASYLSFASQQSLDYLSSILYNRIPLTAIGYNPNNGDFKYIGWIQPTDVNYTIFEWISGGFDERKENNLSGLIDIEKSNKNEKYIYAVDYNKNFINTIMNNKFNKDVTDGAIVFAGSFDLGDESSISDTEEYKNAWGWHNHEHKYIYTINKIDKNGEDAKIYLNELDKNDTLYEKFYYVDTAYTLALGKDINQNAICIQNLINNKIIKKSDINNTLFLFYNYRPWQNQTFCADKNGINKDGNVTILASNVKGFLVRSVNTHLEIRMTLFVNKSDINVTISKQKVTF